MTRTIRAADLFDLRSVGQVALDPNGDRVAFTVTWPDRESDENRSVIHLLEGAASSPITEGHRDTSPLFSPDGTRLLFLRAEPKRKPRPAILDLATGAIMVIDGFDDDGAEQVAWLGDQSIMVRAAGRPDDQVDVDDDELKRRPRLIRKVDYRFNERGWTHDRRRQVSVVDLSEPAITRLTDPEIDHSDAATSLDGSAVIVIAASDADADITGTHRVWLLPVDGADPILLTPDPGRWDAVGFSADGAPFALGTDQPGRVQVAKLFRLDPTGTTAPLKIADHDVSSVSAIGGGPRPHAVGDSIWVSGIRGTTITVDRHDLTTGALTSELAGPFAVRDFDVVGSRLVAAVSTPTRPAELWAVEGDGEPAVLVALNEELLAELDLAEPELVKVPSTERVEVEAFLIRPPASVRETEPGPGLVYVHGGPMSTYSHTFFDEFQLAAADGYTVIAGNPRGSDGYGEQWAASIVGDLGIRDWADVTALTEHLAALPDVDDSRIGIGGGSYGGFMASWAIGHTQRYRAALVERAVTNWESMAGTSDIGSYFLPMLLDASPETDVERLRHQSPITYAAAVTTPTLILHSEEDWRCPIEQAEQLFAAYRRGGVDVTFVRFPGENHELSRSGSPRHRVERFGFIHDFFATHLHPDGRRSRI